MSEATIPQQEFGIGPVFPAYMLRFKASVALVADYLDLAIRIQAEINPLPEMNRYFKCRSDS